MHSISKAGPGESPRAQRLLFSRAHCIELVAQPSAIPPLQLTVGYEQAVIACQSLPTSYNYRCAFFRDLVVYVISTVATEGPSMAGLSAQGRNLVVPFHTL